MSCNAQEDLKDLTHIVERFWKLEEANTLRTRSDVKEVRYTLKENFHRDTLGRYIVSLTFKIPKNVHRFYDIMFSLVTCYL